MRNQHFSQNILMPKLMPKTVTTRIDKRHISPTLTCLLLVQDGATDWSFTEYGTKISTSVYKVATVAYVNCRLLYFDTPINVR